MTEFQKLYYYFDAEAEQVNCRVMVFNATFNNISVISWYFGSHNNRQV
jgi:hypothetical protein